ncbi:MAG: hypothetical protein WCS96_14160 [Victivallales bacterium]
MHKTKYALFWKNVIPCQLRILLENIFNRHPIRHQIKDKGNPKMFMDIHAYRRSPPLPVQFCTVEQVIERYDKVGIEKGVGENFDARKLGWFREISMIYFCKKCI